MVLDRRSRKSSILWQAAASHLHQRRTKGEIRRDTDEEHGGNENCSNVSNVTKVSQTFSLIVSTRFATAPVNPRPRQRPKGA